MHSELCYVVKQTSLWMFGECLKLGEAQLKAYGGWCLISPCETSSALHYQSTSKCSASILWPVRSIFPVLIITNATVCYYESFYPVQCTACCLFVNGYMKLCQHGLQLECLPVLPTAIDLSRPSALKAHHYPRRAFRLHEMFMRVQLSVSYMLAVSCSYSTWLVVFPDLEEKAADNTLVSLPLDKTGLVLRRAFCYLEMHWRTSHLLLSLIARGM